MRPIGQGQSKARSSELSELARLRERAYGPDSDIHADPEALRRLIELEGRASPHAPEVDDAEVVPDPQPEPEVTEPTNEPKPRKISGAALALAWTLTVVTAFGAGGVVGSSIEGNDPTLIATLVESRELDVPDEFTTAEFAGATRFDDYLGLTVVAFDRPSVDGSQPQKCIGLQDGDGQVVGGCTAGNLDPIAQITVDANSSPSLRAHHAPGTVVQFQQSGERINVRGSDR